MLIRQRLIIIIMMIIIIMTSSLPASNAKYCIVRTINTKLLNYANDLKNCTFIDGFLNIKIREDDAQFINQLMEALNRIDFVTGYISINAFTVSYPFTHFSMKNLQIIYGEILFMNQFSLFIESDKLTQFDFRSLKSISKGNIGIQVNKLPCQNKNMIDFNEIFDNPNEQKIVTYSSFDHCNEQQEYKKNFECHKNCDKIKGKAFCFGPDEEQCQKATRCTKQSCSNTIRCYFDKESQSEKPCHFLCAGGCFNSSASDCYGCVGLTFKGECLTTCPKGSYQWLRTCVDSCPKTTLIFETVCVWSCPDGFTNVNGFCTKCDLNECPKSCKLLDANGNHISALNRSALLSVRNCEYIIGSVIINDFNKMPGNEDPITSIEDLMSLIKVKRIDGVILLNLHNLPNHLKNHQKFQSVFFLQNLEEVNEIKSANINHLGNAFAHTPFVYLGFASLRKFNTSTILFLNNPKLNYIQSVNWNKLGVKKVKYHKNSPQFESCDPSCDVNKGCMGPGPAQCLRNLQE